LGLGTRQQSCCGENINEENEGDKCFEEKKEAV
jgi:hypothetical protein